MRKNIVLTIIMVLCCLSGVAQIVKSNQLADTNWKLSYPALSGCDRYMSFKKNILNLRLIYTSINKDLSYDRRYYLSDNVPRSFDESKVGKLTSGVYLVEKTFNGFLCYKITNYTGYELRMVLVPTDNSSHNPDPLVWSLQ